MAFNAFTAKRYWDASTNDLALVAGRAENGDAYLVSVAGSTDLGQDGDWQVGDLAYFAIDRWVRVGTPAGVSGVTRASYNALRAYRGPATSATVLSRTTFGDGGGGPFAVKVGDTTSPDDGAMCLVDALGRRWWRIWDNTTVNSLWFTTPNGTDDDLAALIKAEAYARIGGRTLYLAPAACAYVFSSGTGQLVLGNGVKFEGSGTFVFPGATAPIAEWTASGSWIRPTHASNSAVKMAGHGCAVKGINFIHVQPTPSDTPLTAWTPNTYGYCIEQVCSHSFIENIRIVNASHGIHVNYTEGSGGGTNCWIEDVIISAYAVRLRMTNVNDTMDVVGFKARNLWYSSNSNVVDRIRANTIGALLEYVDNLLAFGWEFFEDYKAIVPKDGTCLGNTHGPWNCTFTNTVFNLPQIAMAVDTSTTAARLKFVNTVAQTGNAFGRTWSDVMFQLGSDNIQVDFVGLDIVQAGGQIFDIGAGSGGKVSFTGLRVEGWSTVAAGQPAIGAAAGSQVAIHGVSQFTKPGGAGVRLAGAGQFIMRVSEERIFSYLGASPTVNCNGSYQDYSTRMLSTPLENRYLQGRLAGQIYVATAAVGGTVTLRVKGHPEIVTGAIPATAIGWQSFDSGYIDFAGTDAASFDCIEIVGTNTVVVNNAEVSLLER